MPINLSSSSSDSIKPKLRRYVLFCEGTITEHEYFTKLVQPYIQDTALLEIAEDFRQGTDINSLVTWANTYLAQPDKKLCGSDEAWIIVDKDENDFAQLTSGVNWAAMSPAHFLALSNPSFELWLLCHFENPPFMRQQTSKKVVCNRLSRHHCMTGKRNKYLDLNYFNDFISKVNNAIACTDAADTPPCPDYPHSCGSTVYHLAEKLFL